jgi:hypothetical protein
VYKNAEGFVSGGTREALKHVESDFFVSVDADTILARNWWEKIPRHMADPMCLCAQGTQQYTLSALTHIAAAHDEFERLIRLAPPVEPDNLQQRRVHSAILGGRSFANNLWRTEILRKLGGFPSVSRLFVDEELFKIVRQTDYTWVVDESVVCPHIRESVLGAARHSFNTTATARRMRQSSPLIWIARWGGETLLSPRVCASDPSAFPAYFLQQTYLLKALAVKWLRSL